MKARTCLLFALCASILVSTVSSQTCNDITVGTSIFTPSSANVASVTLTGNFITAPSYNVSASETFTVNFGSAIFASAPTCTATPGTASLTWAPATSSAVATVATGVIIIGGTNVSWSCVGATTGVAPIAANAVDLCVSTTKNVIPKCGKLPALGGAVSAVTLTLTSGDTIPNKATAGQVTIVFTAATIIPANGIITVTTPYKYFATRSVAAAAGTSEITCATACSASAPTVGDVTVVNTDPVVGTTAGYGTVTIVVASHPTTASAITVKLGAATLTTGSAQAAVATGITVSTTQDSVSPGATSTALAGGAVSAVTLTLDAGDRVPSKATAALVTIAFTAANAIPAGGSIIITTPYMYFADRSGALQGSSTITCASSCSTAAVASVVVTNTAPTDAATPGFGTVTIVTATAATTPSAITITIGIATLTTGLPQAAVTTGITVSTSQDTVSPGAPSTALPGGAITLPAITLVAGDAKPSQTTTGLVTVAFTAATAIPAGGSIIITTPYMYFATRSSATAIDGTSTFTCGGSGCSTAGSVATVATVAVTNTPPSGSTAGHGTVTIVTVATGAGPTIAAQTVSLTLGIGMFTTGPPQTATQSAITAGFTISTSKDSGVTTGTTAIAGGAVSGVTLTLSSGDAVPNKATAGQVTVVFTAATIIPANGIITVTTPYKYFATRGANAAAGTSEITCASACSTNVPTVGNVAVVNTDPVGTTAGYGTVTIVVASHPTTASAITVKLGAGTLTTGPAQAAVTTGITVSTTQDTVSPGVTSTAIVAGAVTLPSVTLVAADQTSGQLTTGLVTIAFTAATAIPVGGIITITTPYMYFATRSSGTALAGTSTITCGSACSTTAPTVSSVAVTNTAPVGTTAGFGTVTIVTATGATTASAITITIGIGTLTTGAPYAANAAGVKISTTQDTISAGGASSSTASPAIAVCPSSPGADSPSNTKSSASLYELSVLLIALLFLFA